MGYHSRPIQKGTLGELSKVREELEEAMDAEEQGAKIMLAVELSDLLGAVEAYALAHLNLTMADLLKMKDLTKRAFESGGRK